MAGRFNRVLLALSLPAIIAIVSFYWFRKRKKALPTSSDCGESESVEKALEKGRDEGREEGVRLEVASVSFDPSEESESDISSLNFTPNIQALVESSDL